MQKMLYLCAVFMDKKALFYTVEWVVALAACAYLAYRLVTFEDYASLWASFSAMTWRHYVALVLSVALMPLNMTLEAWRWKTLLPMAWHDAHLQVYYSKLAGLITPWRIGEYPARALLRNEWKQTLSMGAVGSATMTFAIILVGVPAIMANGLWVTGDGVWWMAVAAAMILLTTGLLLAPRMLRRWADVSHTLVLISIGQSLVRLFCWCVQLCLVLYALDGLGDIGVIGGIGQSAVYYLLVTVTPNVPIAEAGVRGVWAIMLFGSMNAAFAGVLLWAINTLLPCFIWPFLRKNR